jgi:hypothetical protein
MPTTWTAPITRAAGYVVLNDTDWNEMVMDNLDYLYAHYPPVAYVGYSFVGTHRLPDSTGD